MAAFPEAVELLRTVVADIHGLRVGICAETAVPAALPTACDLIWESRRVDALPNVTSDHYRVSLELRAGEAWMQHLCADAGRTIWRFFVAADGKSVVSEALPSVPEIDLVAVFRDTIMRTVLVRRGLVALHAAALEKDGVAILIMGEKGAGKSTLSCALSALGWTLLADDLVRVFRRDGVWNTARGEECSKLNDDSASALGYRPAELASRWAVEKSVIGNKAMVPHRRAGGADAVPIGAMFTLASRAPGASAIARRALAPVDQVRTLVANLIGDPLHGQAPPSPQALEAIAGSIRQARLCELALPDSLDQLVASARDLDRQLRRDMSGRGETC